MSEVNMQSSEELWEQNYEEMMESIPDLLFSPSARSKGNGPKGGVEKPVRRRSRSSKKAPTTLLTADANNFRALVQQFTGWHSATPLLRAYRGPINLNFKQRSYYPQQQQQNLKVHVESNFVPPFGAKKMINAGLDELFVPGMGETPRGDGDGDGALTFDNFWGSGDYSTVLSAVDHEFWGY